MRAVKELSSISQRHAFIADDRSNEPSLGKKHVVRSFPELGHYLQVFIYLISSLKIRYKAYNLSSLVRVVVCRALSASINLKK